MLNQLAVFTACSTTLYVVTCVIDERLLESSESYKAASQRASLEVERLRAENEDLKQQLDAGFAHHCCLLCSVCVLYLLTFIVHLLQIMSLHWSLQCFATVVSCITIVSI